jgi:acetoin utilization protein AcuB
MYRRFIGTAVYGEGAMLEDVLVREWMSSPVISVEPQTPISQAHQIMKDNGIRRLPVLKEGELLGMVTIGDIREASPSDATTLSIWELNYLWAQLLVGQVMTRHPVTTREDVPIGEAARIMLDRKIGGLPVLDAQDRLVGMLTESDVFRMLVRIST